MPKVSIFPDWVLEQQEFLSPWGLGWGSMNPSSWRHYIPPPQVVGIPDNIHKICDLQVSAWTHASASTKFVENPMFLANWKHQILPKWKANFPCKTETPSFHKPNYVAPNSAQSAMMFLSYYYLVLLLFSLSATTNCFPIYFQIYPKCLNLDDWLLWSHFNQI